MQAKEVQVQTESKVKLLLETKFLYVKGKQDKLEVSKYPLEYGMCFTCSQMKINGLVLHLVSKTVYAVKKTHQIRVDATVKLYKKEFYVSEQELN